MWALKILHETNWRVSLSVFRNSFIHKIFAEFLQPLRDVRRQRRWLSSKQRVSPFYSGFLFIWFWVLGWLGSATRFGSKQRVSPFYHFLNICTWHKHWMGIDPTQISPFSSLTVACYCCTWWNGRAWGRCGMITLLSWRCHWGWRMRTGGRTRWQAWNHNGNEVLRVALHPNPVLLRCGFWPLIHSKEYLFSSQNFPSDNTAGVFSRTFIVKNLTNSLTYTAAPSCVCTSPLAVMTFVGQHDVVKVSISASLKSFLLIMCIDAPESTTNSLSSGFNVDAGRHLFSGDEKNVALFSPLIFKTLLANFHAASRAACSCHSVSSWGRSSNYGALGLRWWGSPGQTSASEGFRSRMHARRATAFVIFLRRIGFRMSELLDKIDEDFGGSIS